ncbi:cytochrome P450 2L1-like isoform X2 [Eriocheir sinensis]|uniref:cytochrome P450 2L1-like isoform X2 n=1 Tax=Eriocheir sinensis TaxID=95602 RepID=UPI0021C96F7A|nr:cytochrome P450 2L1-like isoform X2 [Eriocheir sinensis]XP_050694746.1 cytochrome P450 2L1-like isoform X2 [Eriocheir sinensis]
MVGVQGLTTGPLGGWLSTFLLTLFIILLLSGKFGGRPKNFPPGLMILPFVGSLQCLPFGPSTEMLRGLRKKYGDMASFGILGNRLVLVSSVKLIKEVFSLPVTTQRPDMVFTTTMSVVMTAGKSAETGLAGSSGREWQDQRRFVLHHLRDLGFGKSNYEPMMLEEITELTDHLAKQEGEGKKLEIKHLFNRSILNILWGMIMGKRYPYGDPRLAKVMKGMSQLEDYNFLQTLHHIPYMLRLLPYLPVKTKDVTGIKASSKFLKEEIKALLADEDLRNGNNLTAIYVREIEKNESPSFNMDQLAGLIFDMFAAGQETVSGTLCMGVYLIAKHPHVQRRLQEELDDVVGTDNLPSMLDVERLPYLQATVYETQRLLNLVKYSLAHMAGEDCQLGGYDIPKGTWLLPNLDDAHTSPEYWKKPQEFDPQNFLDENGKFKNNEAFIPFGVGRRVCIGASFAKMELLLFVSHLFQRFTVTVVEEMTPFSEDNPSFNTPPNYTVSVKCRSQKDAALRRVTDLVGADKVGLSGPSSSAATR